LPYRMTVGSPLRSNGESKIRPTEKFARLIQIRRAGLDPPYGSGHYTSSAGQDPPYAPLQGGSCPALRAPLASHRAMNCGGTSTIKTFDTGTSEAGCALGLDMTELRFARQPRWPPLASPSRTARRRVKVCTATRLDLNAPSTVRCWDDNGGHPSKPDPCRLLPL
jgi:hypothetical protein